MYHVLFSYFLALQFVYAALAIALKPIKVSLKK